MKSKLKIILCIVVLFIIALTVLKIISDKQKIREVENEITVVLDNNLAKMKEELDSKNVNGELEYKITNIKKSRNSSGTVYVVSLQVIYQGEEGASWNADDLINGYSIDGYYTKNRLKVIFLDPKTYELQITRVYNNRVRVPKSEEEIEEEKKKYINDNEYECKSCDRKFSDDTNKRYINRTNMCRNCYRNYCYATGKTPENYDK